MTNMNCSTFKKQLENSIENRVTIDSPDFAQHQKECASCAKLWKSSKALDHAIEQWNEEEFNIDLVDRILFHLNPLLPSSTNPNNVNLNPTNKSELPYSADRYNKNNFAAICAVAVVMITAFFVVQSDPDRELQNRMVLTNSNQSNEKNLELDSIIEDVGSAYLSLANDTAHSVTDALTIVGSKDKDTNQKIEGDRSSQYQWIKSLGNDLKPIQKDLGEAMDFLYETLPESSPSTI